MAKKKKQSTSGPKEKKPSLGEDLKLIQIPYSLFTGFSAVVEELKRKDFEYNGIYKGGASTFIFRSKEAKEHITVYVTKDNLLIKQFSELKDDKTKLKVIYVVKDSGRKFKIL